MLPFHGVRVLDLAAPVSAYGGRVLAGYGADVVRLERPGTCATTDDPRAAWLDAWYAAGCRRATLDFADERAAPLLAELAATADVVIASPTAATPVTGFGADPLGLAWCDDTVVTCFLTPFGATGPLRDWRATPLIAHALSGLMYSVGPEAGPPLTIPGRPHWDEAGVRAALCIGAALYERPRVGGQVLDVSAHEVAASQDDILHRFDVAGLVLARRLNFAPPPSGVWAVADGTVDIAANTPGHWDAFVKTMGSPPELAEERWKDRAARIHHHTHLSEIVARRLSPWRREQFIAEGQANGLPCSAFNTPEEFLADQQRDARQPLGTLTHPQLGTCPVPGAPIHTDGPFHATDLVAVAPGHDTEALLTTELGHAAAELAQWREAGLV
jgi:crotonobetainyl-CoA:carnitine CoA-transferase CaiB-like acyl-CoA transferase